MRQASPAMAAGVYQFLNRGVVIQSSLVLSRKRRYPTYIVCVVPRTNSDIIHVTCYSGYIISIIVDDKKRDGAPVFVRVYQSKTYFRGFSGEQATTV